MIHHSLQVVLDHTAVLFRLILKKQCFSIPSKWCSLFTNPSPNAKYLEMTAMKSPSTHVGIELGQNEEKSASLQQQQPGLASIPAKDASDLESGLEHQTTLSSPHYTVEKAFIPDMFVSFVSQKPRLNPHYEVVRLESEAWLKQ